MDEDYHAMGHSASFTSVTLMCTWPEHAPVRANHSHQGIALTRVLQANKPDTERAHSAVCLAEGAGGLW